MVSSMVEPRPVSAVAARPVGGAVPVSRSRRVSARSSHLSAAGCQHGQQIIVGQSGPVDAGQHGCQPGTGRHLGQLIEHMYNLDPPTDKTNEVHSGFSSVAQEPDRGGHDERSRWWTMYGIVDVDGFRDHFRSDHSEH